LLRVKEGETKMRYIAIHYVKVAGRTYTPGEIFPAEMTPEKEERLLRLKSIRRIEEDAPMSVAPVKTEVAEEPEAPKEPEAAEETQGDGGEDDGFTEADEDAPEIDVMDGLVPPVSEEAPKTPAKTKAAAKKIGAKGGKSK
jgi:hypothetical protein